MMMIVITVMTGVFVVKAHELNSIDFFRHKLICRESQMVCQPILLTSRPYSTLAFPHSFFVIESAGAVEDGSIVFPAAVGYSVLR